MYEWRQQGVTAFRGVLIHLSWWSYGLAPKGSRHPAKHPALRPLVLQVSPKGHASAIPSPAREDRRAREYDDGPTATDEDLAGLRVHRVDRPLKVMLVTWKASKHMMVWSVDYNTRRLWGRVNFLIGNGRGG